MDVVALVGHGGVRWRCVTELDNVRIASEKLFDIRYAAFRYTNGFGRLFIFAAAFGSPCAGSRAAMCVFDVAHLNSVHIFK